MGLRVFVLLVASSGVAAFTNAVRPHPLPWVIDPETSTNPGENKALEERISISYAEFRKHLADASATFIDARKPEDYSDGHVVGAINIPSTEVEQHLATVFQRLPPDGLIIIYCGGGQCEASNVVFEFLLGNGLKEEHLRIFKDGWEFLRQQPDLPTAKGME